MHKIGRRIIAAVLCLAMCISLSSNAFAASTSPEQHRSDYQYEYFDDMMRYLSDRFHITDELRGDGSSIIAVARAELEAAEGGDNDCLRGYKYKDAAGIGRSDPWCCAFVYWCAEQCGYIGACFGPKTASCARSWAWFQEQGLTHAASGYIPQPGDLIYYWVGGGIHHIGLVESCDGSVVHTIEGNTRGGKLSTHIYRLSNSTIYGYASPEYPAVSGMSYLTANTPQEYFWLYGLSQGYSPEAVAGIMGNIYQECSTGTKASATAVFNCIMSGAEEWKYQTVHTYASGAKDFGIVQWTDNKSAKGYTQFMSYCNENNLDPTSIEAQTQRVFEQLAGTAPTGRKNIGAELSTASSPEEAAVIFLKFEGAGKPETDHRKWAAKAYYEKFKNLTYASGSFGTGNASIADAAVSMAYKTEDEGVGDFGTPLYQVVNCLIGGPHYNGGNLASEGLTMGCDRGGCAIVSWSGADDQFPAFCSAYVPGQCYFETERGKERWVEIKNWTLDDLQPGDIGIFANNGHVWTYVGYEAAAKRWPDIEKSDSTHDYIVHSSHGTPRSLTLERVRLTNQSMAGFESRVYRNIKPETQSDYKNILSDRLVKALMDAYDSGRWKGDPGKPRKIDDELHANGVDNGKNYADQLMKSLGINASFTKKERVNSSGMNYYAS